MNPKRIQTAHSRWFSHLATGIFAVILLTGCQSEKKTESEKTSTSSETRAPEKSPQKSAEKQTKDSSQKGTSETKEKTNPKKPLVPETKKPESKGLSEKGPAKLPPAGQTPVEQKKEAKSDSTTDPIDDALSELDSKQEEEFDSLFEEIPTPDTFPPEKNWIRLVKGKPIWIDRENKKVVVDGYICQTSAPLEMLAFPYDKGKEYEAVAAIFCQSKTLHAALLAVGARPGKPFNMDNGYTPAYGTVVKIEFQWKDKNGKLKTENAKQFVRNFKTKKTLSTDWVFAGSIIYVDPDTKVSYYLADSGEMVCVSNFSTALLDIPIESAEANEELLFQANPDKVPPKGTAIRMVLTPDLSTIPKTEIHDAPPKPNFKKGSPENVDPSKQQ